MKAAKDLVTTSTLADGSRKSYADRFIQSFKDSVGSIVFGMEDGTVSIFGLVFGVAVSAPNSKAVLLAGATGAVAAAVSMMAGTYLDVESTNDKAAADLAAENELWEKDHSGQAEAVRNNLLSAGFSRSEATTVIKIFDKHPRSRLKVAAAVYLGVGEATHQNPYVQAAWMFFTDLFAAAVPVLPFAFFALSTARIVSVSVTVLLLLVLGVGRAIIGRRKVLTTVLETIGIAAAAAVAGVAIGKLVA